MVAQGLYPEYWEADVVLRDGSTGHLRPISPDDADAVQAFHMRQSQNSIYLRFFTYKSSLSEKELKRFTEVDHVGRVAFVVTRGQDIIGIGRYDRLDNPDEAEVAFNVSDAYQGRGLGSILLEHLAAAARENGIRRFTAEVLPENRKMITVFAEAGYEVERRFDDGVVELNFNIDPTERSRAVMEAREHRAEARSMQTLLAPSSVAVIGASRSWGSVGYSLLEHIVDGGFTGPVAGVNPEAFELNGMVAYGSIAEVPGPVDLAVIAVPYDQVLAVVEECGRAGVKGLLVATAGFADDDGEGLSRQRALVHCARSYGMRVVGPASLGIINTDPAVRLNASMAPELPVPGGLGLFSQSAAIGVMLHAAAARRSLGLSSALSAGNRADVSGNDAMQYWEDDPRTRAVALYLESIGNPRKFSRIARRLSRMKPVIVAKSDVMGLQLPPGHAVRTTQAPAGALDAMLRQSGVIRVETNEQLMDVAQIVVGQPVPDGAGVAVFSNSLALGKVLADAARSQQLEVVRMDAHLELDGGQSVALPALEKALTEALEDPAVSSLILTLIPAVGLAPEAILPVLNRCGRAAGKAVVACFTGVLDPAAQLEGLRSGSGGGSDHEDATVPCFASPGAAVSALGAVVRYSRWRAGEHGVFAELEGIDEEAAAAQLAQVLSGVRDVGLRRLDSGQAGRLLGAYGISVLPSIPFDSIGEALEAAEALGWPVALKTVEENLRHRLDFGGVRLNIGDQSGLRAGIEAMRAELRPFGSPGLEIQAMAPPGQACVIRAIEDPLLGPVISFGLAGDAVNLLDDWAHGIPPLTTVDVADLVRTPRASRRLFGYQGLPPVDIPAIEDLLLRVALLKDRHPEIALLRFNPVLVSASGLAILSAEVSVGNPQQRTDSARRAMRD
ncbi:bifunctional GNAT family N-acetyltransferase/acetate--CoA ligase family protein [Arthrobacter subterraneus]|uniref:bifunctional acetate--CoA ligase family protein/GNAT family N-acetyltransferase n=1 Tax=Arthrobacter subterraneus TaxID=335973 RepID=UPI000B89B2CD|nr:bifunctional GNAT family N-acetyltransferase/acetate--CoA ligase family protein [Arthrobacter subterraneus]